MARKPSPQNYFLQFEATRRCVAELRGLATTDLGANQNTACVQAAKQYLEDADSILHNYIEIQELADKVLTQSLNVEERQEVIDKLADFCVKVHELSSEELAVFVKVGRQNSLCELFDLEQELRKNTGKDFKELDVNIKARLNDMLNYSFASNQPARIDDDTRQIGTSFMYCMLPVLNGIDMENASAVNAIYSAKQRAGIEPNSSDEFLYTRYQAIKTGNLELQSSRLARQIDKRFAEFMEQSISLNKHKSEKDFIQRKLDLTCNYINTLISDMHSRYANPTNLYTQTDNELIKTIFDCVLFCEQSKLDGSFEELLDDVHSLPNDAAFACAILLKAYGHNAGKFNKHLDAFNISFDENGITSGVTKQNATEQTILNNDEIDNAIEENQETQDLEEQIQETEIETNKSFDDSISSQSEQPTTKTRNSGGRKPTPITGWLYNEIKQAYLNDENTTDEMRAQFANMTHEQQFALLREDANNKLIYKAKNAVKQAINNYENLSRDEQKKIDELCAGYEHFNTLLANKKAEIQAKTDAEVKEIRDRVEQHKKSQRAEKAKRSAMSNDEQTARDENLIIYEIQYNTALDALTKNGKAVFSGYLSATLDKEREIRVLNNTEIENLKLLTLYQFIATASATMVKKDITPYLISAEDAKETEEYKKSQETKEDPQENILEYFSLIQ